MNEKAKTPAQKMRKHRQNMARKERKILEKLEKTMKVAPNRYKGNDDKGMIKKWEGKRCIFYKAKDGRYIVKINGEVVSVQNSYINAERMAITIANTNKADYIGYLEKLEVGHDK